MTGQSRWLLILWLCCLSEGPGYAAPLNDQLMQSELLSIDEPLNDIFDAGMCFIYIRLFSLFRDYGVGTEAGKRHSKAAKPYKKLGPV